MPSVILKPARREDVSRQEQKIAAQNANPPVWGMLLALMVVAFDQATKWWVLLVLMNPPKPVYVAPFFNLVLVWNQGISFGLFQTGSVAGKWFLVAIATGICTGLLVWLRRAENRRVVVAIGLIVGGAIGNVIDRLVHGAVVDFVDWHIADHHWPAFNGADSAICIGAGLLIVDSLMPGSQNSPEPGSH